MAVLKKSRTCLPGVLRSSLFVSIPLQTRPSFQPWLKAPGLPRQHWCSLALGMVMRKQNGTGSTLPPRTVSMKVHCFYPQPLGPKCVSRGALPHWNVFCFGAWHDRKHSRKPCCNLHAHRHMASLQCEISSVFSSFRVSSRPLCNLQTEDNR